MVVSYNHSEHVNVLVSLLIQRFIPAEFGVDPDKVQISGQGHGFYSRKAEIRRFLEAQGIPYTCISCNLFMSLLLPFLAQPDLDTPPREMFTIFGDGNTKGMLIVICSASSY